MDPNEMTLTKDHVKVLIHIVPLSQQLDTLILPPMDSMEHYEHIKARCTDLQQELSKKPIDELGMSALKRYFKSCTESDDKPKQAVNTEEDTTGSNSPKLEARQRRLSLGTSLEWDSRIRSAAAEANEDE